MDCHLGAAVSVPGMRSHDEPVTELATSVAMVCGDSDHRGVVPAFDSFNSPLRAFEIPIRSERDSRLFALRSSSNCRYIAFRVTVIEFTHSVSLEASISSIFRFSSSAFPDMNFRLSAKSLQDIG